MNLELPTTVPLQAYLALAAILFCTGVWGLINSRNAVIVDVRIDYSKRTRFTQGIVKTVLKRFPLGDKIRFVGRALLRKVTG